MKKLIAAIIVLMVTGTDLAARLPFLKFGVEWGYDAGFMEFHHFNYLSSEGYRINDKWTGARYATNGSILLNAGIRLKEKSTLALYGGYSGICEGNRVFPLSLRYTFNRNQYSRNGMFYYADAGIGLHVPKTDTRVQSPCIIGRLGSGYRIALSSFCSLDFMLSLKISYEKPLIIDPDTITYVPDTDIRTSKAFYGAICISTAFNF